MIRYYTEIAEAVKLPIIMYNVPGRTGCNIMPETAATLFKTVENIVGIKGGDRQSGAGIQADVLNGWQD